MCTTLSNCTTISTSGGTTSAFNGLPATTSLQIRVRWSRAFGSGSIPGGVKVMDNITVNYS
jgi:hypothetical protein